MMSVASQSGELRLPGAVSSRTRSTSMTLCRSWSAVPAERPDSGCGLGPTAATHREHTGVFGSLAARRTRSGTLAPSSLYAWRPHAVAGSSRIPPRPETSACQRLDHVIPHSFCKGTRAVELRASASIAAIAAVAISRYGLWSPSPVQMFGSPILNGSLRQIASAAASTAPARTVVTTLRRLSSRYVTRQHNQFL
ncbi:Uncharacterised protein [Mycobacteroides abscessus subsp. abscessus]|nr:hypothetical protein [Mycobacteroides abscessus]SIE91375.1 Uncharacterised protein [Mycobacteroides abscessus subsp. abscessus]SLD95843.1 Uncharacterised protein [Mycobacteroides abscessus subsp. massiliense]SIG11512.1 Uncharacterised protein [Mycobacteroides abscessus subsp. abscessus]SIG59823.1 Uncharacterised protein [Mycobacteroides abscessus subsp. abscessus]